MIDPRSIQTLYQYDAAGRLTRQVNAYDPSVNGGNTTPTQNLTTTYKYTGLDQVQQVTVYDMKPCATAADMQTTTYEYGTVNAPGSTIILEDLLGAIVSPDGTQLFTYNLLGQKTTETELNGTVHAYTYDAMGRQVADKVQTLGLGLDNTVLELGTAYNALGLVTAATSYGV